MPAPANSHDTDALVEDVTWLADHGVGTTEAAQRTGMRSAKNLDKWLRRHDQADLANRLHRLDPTSVYGQKEAS